MIVGFVLTVLCFGLYISGSKFIQAVSNYAYDAFLRRVNTVPQSGRVTIVDIDEASLREIGQWPWSRHVVADLTREIVDAGASVVAFDVVFPEKDRTSPSTIVEDMNRHFGLSVAIQGVPGDMGDFDAMFASALKRGKCILGCQMHEQTGSTKDPDDVPDSSYRTFLTLRGSGDISRYLLHARAITMSIDILNEAAQKGFFNAVPDSDGVVRSNPLIWTMGTRRVYPSLALEAIRLDRNASRCIVDYDANGVTQIRMPPGLNTGELILPVDQSGSIAINYRKNIEDTTSGFASTFPIVSARDILNGAVPRRQLKGKIVFVGTSAVGLKDIKATPLTQYFSGVEVHATIVDNILAGDMLWNPTWMIVVHAASILLLGTLLTFLISRARAWLSFVVAVGTVLLLIQTSYFLFSHFHVVFIPAWVILSVVAVYSVLTMLMFWQEELNRKHVRNMFSTMVSEHVLNYLEKNPDSFSLSGTKVEATMLFSDLAGFTTISESLEPERLSELLNRYLTPMTHLIMKRNGYLDKYEGDLIMAVWGVPFPSDDHAIQACLSALEQQKELAALRPILKKTFGHELHVRIGINTGPATAGNMGSDRKMQYTVIGEAVNLASRLQTTNKEYDTQIMIGETTYLQAREAIDARLLDILIAKGTTKAVRVYELIGAGGDVSKEKAEMIGLYEDALRFHWDRRWDDALLLLDRCLNIDPRDPPSIRLRERIHRYMQTAPPENWTGELWRP